MRPVEVDRPDPGNAATLQGLQQQQPHVDCPKTKPSEPSSGRIHLTACTTQPSSESGGLEGQIAMGWTFPTRTAPSSAKPPFRCPP